MSDFERYGDYNEYEDDAPRGRRNYVGLMLKLLVGVLCVSVAGIIGFRIFLFNYYPDSMKELYRTDALIKYEQANSGKIDAMTQSIRIKYDDPDDGNFFADNLIFVKEAGELQICVRYNDSLFEAIKEKYKVELDPSDKDNFTFTLERNHPVEEGGKTEKIGTLVHRASEEFMMYNYIKLAFSDVDFGTGESEASWIRLRIDIKGVDKKHEFFIAIYESYVPIKNFK